MKSPARILVVDDEPDLQLLIRQRFRQRIKANDYLFDFAANGSQALDKLKEAEFDMIMTDINMPEMDGLSLLLRLKESFRHQKAIVVSAYGDMENIRTAMNRGAFDFITKPIDFSDLELTIDKTINEIKIIKEGLMAKDRLESTLLEKELAEVEKQKAIQSEKFKQQFLANMSHEIRTPMNSIIGLSNLLTKTNLDEQQSKYLNVIKKASENLLVIINDILDLSKIEAGKMEFEKIPFDLLETIDIAYQTLFYKAENKKLDYTYHIANACPKKLVGDPSRLTQIIINIVGNSIKFTEKGFVKMEVREVNKQGNSVYLEFKISDSGIGISRESLNLIWNSFSQASSDTNRKFGGTGLGLTISRQLVDLQGGKITVSSEVGKGTTFTFTIPFIISSGEAIKEEASEEAVDLETLNGLKLLLVEDNEFNQMVAIDTISDLIPGVSIEVAGNGAIALEKVISGNYDLVLMDIQMPEMDGFQATKEIRSLTNEKSNIKIMAMTANVTTEEVARCFECGMNEYISKPFDADILLKKIALLHSTKPINN